MQPSQPGMRRRDAFFLLLLYGLKSISTGVPSGDTSVSTRTTTPSDQRCTGTTWRRKLLDEISSGPGQPLAPGHTLLAACARPRVLPVDVTARIRHGIGNHGTDSVRGAPRWVEPVCVSRSIGRGSLKPASVGCSQVGGLTRDCALRYMPLHPPYARKISKKHILVSVLM